MSSIRHLSLATHTDVHTYTHTAVQTHTQTYTHILSPDNTPATATT